MGIETVYINDNRVSKKLSLPNTRHKFDLDVFGKRESFFIKSKQSFFTGHVIVQLFHNSILIDERLITTFSLIRKEDLKNPESSSFMTGLILLFLSIIFDWSRFFVFVGLICVFSSLFEKPKNSPLKKDTNISDVDDELPIS